MKEEIEIILPNGYAIQLFKYEGGFRLGLVDSSSHYVSGTKLTETEIDILTKLMNDFQADRWLREECK